MPRTIIRCSCGTKTGIPKGVPNKDNPTWDCVHCGLELDMKLKQTMGDPVRKKREFDLLRVE